MNPFTLNPWIALGAAMVLLAAGFGTGWKVNGWRLHADVADLKTQAAATRAAGAESALSDLTAAAARIKGAAEHYGAVQSNLGGQIAQLREDIKNAKPLPADCSPDDFRMLKLAGAIGAAGKAAAGQ